MSTIPTNKVNMSLDDIIKQNRQGNKSRGRGGRKNFGERRGYKNKPRRAERKEGEEIKNVEEKRTRLFVSNLQKEIVNAELRVRLYSIN